MRVCNKCHDAGRIVQTRRPRAQWEELLEQMVARGAKGSDEDLDTIMDYLVSTFGRVNVNTATAADIAQVLGLAPANASSIVEFRKAHGRFEDFDALTAVPGAPVTALQELRDAITF